MGGLLSVCGRRTKTTSAAAVAQASLPFTSQTSQEALYRPPTAGSSASKGLGSTLPRWASGVPPIFTVSPSRLHPSLKSNVAPTAREAKKQILSLVQPERIAPLGRTLGHLGRGSSSTSLVRLTNYKLSIGRLTRLLASHGNTYVAEKAVLKSLVRALCL